MEFSPTFQNQEQPARSPNHRKKTATARFHLILDALVFLARQLAFALIVLLAIAYLGFLGLDMARGTPLNEAAGAAVGSSVSYIGSLLKGELGVTSAGVGSMMVIPVREILVERLPRSLVLLGIAIALAAILGVVLGIRAATRRSGNATGVLITTLIGISVPSFFLAFLLQWLFVNATRQFGRQILPVGGFGWDKHLILPVIVLAAWPLAQITRITFVTLRGVLQQDYVRTAHSKGLRSHMIMRRHVLRNAAIAILTTIGTSLRFSLSSLPVVEAYFGWPGIGYTLLGAIALRDDELAVALLLCLGLVFLIINFLLDVSYKLIDPRVGHTPDFLGSDRRLSLWQSVRMFFAAVADYVRDNAITRWITSTFRRREEKSFGELLARREQTRGADNVVSESETRRKPSLWHSVWKNTTLIVGALLLLVLLIVVVFGPALSPHSPYNTVGLELIDGELVAPPFGPSEEYPWGTDALGRDLMSLILIGAQLTLSLALMVVVTRMAAGIVLGAIAGWANGTWLDRAITGAANVISAFPALLLAMIVILALGIRAGLRPFVIGLAIVGWGNAMFFVRGEVISIRPRSFIESAVASGARAPRIIGRHILPNLFPPLISLFALEMGAVLMILGELGFLSIFIGGGSFLALDTLGAPFHYSDVPEWGALLSNIRTYSRAYPWLAFYPTLAFFVAILSFNFFGEGFRRLVDEGSLVVNRIFNKYTLTVGAIMVAGLIWLRSYGGTAAFYQQHAARFSAQNAYQHIQALTGPELEGRALGTEGLNIAADYIAAQFSALGLQPAGQKSTFLQERTRSFERLEALPEFSIADGLAEPFIHEDFAVFPGPYMSSGAAEGPVRVIVAGQPAPTRGYGTISAYPDMRHADYSNDILLLLNSRDAYNLSDVGDKGMLVVATDADLLARRFTLSGRSLASISPFGNRPERADTPTLWISEATANRILANAGTTVAELNEQATELGTGEFFELESATNVSMRVDGVLEERWPVHNIIGYMPGFEAEGSSKLDNELIVVLAQYDSPPAAPGESFHPGANNNASAVAVMLEAIRVMNATEYRPKRTFLFVAYSGEGIEGGREVSKPSILTFLQAKTGFAAAYTPHAIVWLRGLGGGSGDSLEVSAGGSLRLAETFERAASRVDAEAKRSEDPIDISVIYQTGSAFDSAQEAPEIRLSWEGWDANAFTPLDTVDTIRLESLENAGKTLALALMTMGAEREY